MKRNGSQEHRSRNPSSPSDGYSLLEALLAILLTFVVLNATLGLLATERRLFEGIVERGRFLEAVRVARVFVGREVRQGGRIEGSGSIVGDSIRLRVFRGWALVCFDPNDSPGQLTVERTGLRAPDPQKDSVLLPVEGGIRSVALTRVESASGASTCAGQGIVERWTVAPPVEPTIGIVRYFERGSVHLADGSIRYRRGRSGRQPLTAEVLHEASTIQDGPLGAITLRLGMRATQDTTLAAIWTWSTVSGSRR